MSSPGHDRRVQHDRQAPAPEPSVSSVSSVAELADVHRVLSLLAEAITGEPISLDPVDAGTAEVSALTMPRRSFIAPEFPADRRRTARLPRHIDRFDLVGDNMRAYRAVLLRQLGRAEFETHGIDPESRPEGADVPMTREERRLDPSSDPALLWQLYGVLEDIRIGAELRRRYPGARRDLDLLDADELRDCVDVPDAATMRVLAVDALTRCALGAPIAAARWGHDVVGSTTRWAQLLRSPGASAQTSAVFAWELTAAILRDERAASRADGALSAAVADEEHVVIPEPEADESSSASSDALLADDDLDLLGDVDAVDGLDVPGFALTANLLADLSPDADSAGSVPDAGGGATGPEIEVSAGADGSDGEDDPDPASKRSRTGSRRAQPAETLARVSRTYLYDEWDVTHRTYLRGWCRLREIRLEGTVDGMGYASDVRQRHATLAAQVRRRFATITPNAFARVHRTLDGDELSTDALIESVVERRRGRTGDDRVYVRRDRAQREVAAAFLLDMSRSTDHPVIDPDAPLPAPVEPTDPDPFESYWDLAPLPVAPVSRRVIDVAKDALVLMCDALETLGDLHAVYGFSGNGRANVEFFVAKDFNDPSGGATSARVAAMEPVRYTRMGPAVRHAARRLARVGCRTRVLVVVSDGYPQDEDYGPDRNDREYGIADTAKALDEAERLGITTFCITIDPAGRDYLRRMCPSQRYLVLEDIHQLPSELEKVYRALTGRAGVGASLG